MRSAEAIAQMVRQAARLTCQHKEIAVYYYSDLFLASKDVSAYFEYLYHRISSIRYATILAALLFKCDTQIRSHRKPPGALSANPVDTYLERMLQPKRPGWKHRLNDIRALEQTLVRDREVLLSQVPSDTLLGWIDWIVTHDLNRFRTRYYVAEGAKGIPGERPIETEVRKLLRMLLDLRAKVLRLKTDYRACIEARILQIEHLLEDLEFPVDFARGIQRQPRTYRYDKEIADIKQRLITKYKTPLLKKSQRRRCFDALGALLDVGVCLNGLGEFEQAASIIAWLREAIEPMKAKKGKEGIELAEHYEPLELKIHFRAAELILSSVDRWDYKNDALAASSDLKERCDRAIKECEAGQRIVHETNTEPEKYFVYRSSLRIHRARALALDSKFVTAQQDFDRAMAGLDPRTGSGRNALAVRTLYLVESRMAFADYQLMRNLRKALAAQNHTARLSAQGQFFLGFDKFISKLDPTVTRSDEKEVIRRAMTPWANCLADDPAKTCECFQKSLDLIRTLNPRIKDEPKLAANALEKENLRAAWREAVDQNVNNEWLALGRSLAYWSADSLTMANANETLVNTSGWNWRRIGAQTLASVHSTLDQAEGYLTNARRDIQFWYLLHRSRASLFRGAPDDADSRTGRA